MKNLVKNTLAGILLAAMTTGAMAATTILRAAFWANRERATWVMACHEDRSPIPISTVPLPTGMMSPPSRVDMP